MERLASKADVEDEWRNRQKMIPRRDWDKGSGEGAERVRRDTNLDRYGAGGRRTSRTMCRRPVRRPSLSLPCVSQWIVSWVVLVAAIPRTSPATVAPSSDYVQASFAVPNATLNHAAMDRTTRRLYVGAVNRMYQLDPELRPEVVLDTGAVWDSPSCLGMSSSCDAAVEKRLTDNVNKVLLVDYDNRHLIACGSVYQGACQMYSLPNISHSVNHVERGLAANDEASSTFAFIGPQRYLGNDSRVMYVAVTYTKNGPFRDGVPAISSRRLETLDVAELGFSKTPIVEIDSKLRDYFRVRYKYGFHWGEHAYFVTVQPKSHLQGNQEEGYVSRLARVCIGDPSYSTYTEITLQCLAPNGSIYNIVEAVTTVEAASHFADTLHLPRGELVLVAAFANSVNHTAYAYPNVALCAYPLSDIEQKFNENIHMCLNGSVQSRGMDYIAGSLGNCPETGTSGNIFNFCEASLRISGTVPARAQMALFYPNVTATALLGTTTEQHTVLVLGTKNGTLKKILLTGRSSALEYEEVMVDPGQAILSDLVADVSGETIYALTDHRITKLKMENCTKYATCSSCIGASDPYCGWCSLERRCTVKSTCQNATSPSPSPPRWLSLDSQCIDFQEVKPNMVTIDEMKDLDLTIHELPAGPKYLCVFGDSHPTEATVTPTGLSCRTPPFDMRPKIPKGEDHVTVPLSVRSSETNTDFVSREFHFYDCRAHTTCKSCIHSRWNCNWCVYENTCTSDSSSCRKPIPSVLSAERQVLSSTGRSARLPICPRFARSNNILLPNEVAKEIEVTVIDLPEPSAGQTGYQCIIEIEGAKAVVDARTRDNKVICEERAYTYQLPVGELKANLTVVWNNNHHIDTTEVTLYKCSILGSHQTKADCSLCMIQLQKYGCAWCSNSCTYRKSCSSPPSDDCPKPRIDVIRPLNAPIEGGTLVTIEGGNLGSRADEVRHNISIGDIPCDLVDYNVSVRIVCRAGPSKGGELSTSVRVGNRRNYTVSTEKFYYKNVSVGDVYPNIGPTSGGTRLTIRGENLNVGNSVQVFLDDLPCRVNKFVMASKQISCLTSRSPVANRKITNLRVVIDGAIRNLGYPFTYVHDPTITRIYPTESFASGGRHILVEGTNLEAILNPRMAVFFHNQTINESVGISMCQVINNTAMDCPTPRIDRPILDEASRRRRSISGRLTLRIGFYMDEVQTVMHLAEHFPMVQSELTYLDDPRFFPFDNNRVKLYKGDTLVIEGENLKLASDERDVNVTIGTVPCNVTSLAMSQLVCTPPTAQPKGTDENGRPTDNRLPLVLVRVGDNLRFPIGYLRYEVMKTYEFPEEAIGGIAAGGAFLILLSICILIVYRRKSTQAEREYKRIQIQMDTLESNVRSECKQAFAELQTDMTDLTSDLEATGIPTLDHKTYVMKVFFPGVTEHPILMDPKVLPEAASHLPYLNRRQMVIRTNYDAAMLQFEQLLCNKNFLLVFIDALESQKSFSIRDKVNVASLLMVILMGKMEYATDVLKSLLLKLIEKSVQTKYPQIMLRRTESVVEKMLTNWMALCMYNYLRDFAGSSLFLLFKAIKHQIEKGPVDYVTHDARYSLSEEKLLREQIHHGQVTIQVIQEDLDEKVQCKVLDCDTIGQVKSKILDALYKNTPFSLRPSIHEVDLGMWPEWRHGRGGHLTLQDEDLTTKPVGGWRQLNTLAHYGVKESAVMSLIAKQNDSFTSNCKQPCSNCTGHYSLNSVAPIVSVNGDVEHGVKAYHLIKPMDDHQYIQNSKERTHKAIPEIFLTRLLSTKGTIQKFVDDFFLTILTANEVFPPAIKWLFDTFDDAARRHGIADPEVVHAWKSNSLPLRFWVNFIKNPDFVFDVHKTPTVDACLSVIAQTFMDSCSTSEHRLGKDSPSNKLLFAKDIPHYKEMVSKFYSDIQSMPQITDQEMSSTLQQLSMVHMGEFDTVSALKELYIYATKYSEYILEALETDPYCSRMHLAHKLENVACTFEGEETSTC